MTTRRSALVVVAALLAARTVEARSKQARAMFQRQQPCPSTGKSRGSCPGYVVDHIRPLCAGGPDHHTNMQWQTVDAAKAKDRAERMECRR